MKSVWERYSLESAVVEILRDVPCGEPKPHDGSRPYLTAIKLDERVPDLAAALDVGIGGKGSGRHFSLTSYVAERMSALVRARPDGPVEGAILSNQNVAAHTFVTAGRAVVESSAPGTGFDAWVFRLRGA